GRLPVTKQDFIDYGISHDQIAPAIREAEALGFITWKRGRGGNTEHREPNQFGLTFAYGRESRAAPPAHYWRRLKTMEEAESAAQTARACKNPDAVRFGRRAPGRKKKPVLESRTEVGPGYQDRNT